ncbi:histone deacetylase family protein [Sulfurivermis fontis]|uniref:histone deacetylase family protein n=1 Tax=Sulfurivermis fontis TaxID=1972068 RepID=UPI000FD8A285|nr:histone deacetylase family protein [Sulfurivermis fontis]
MRTAYISHRNCLLHNMGDFHPESPERLHAIEDRLVAAHLMPLLRHYDAPRAERAQLLRVHDRGYVDDLFARAPQPGQAAVRLDPDTWLAPHTLDAALHAAGAVVLGVDLVMSGEMETAFCAIRPPGHHAERQRAMGFCFFNNVAVGAAHALAQHGLERVAILDFDAHHGNGIEDIFKDDPRVLYCSSFQHPFYPETPLADRPNLIHSRLRKGAYSEEFQQAVTEQWLPALDRFAPQLIMVSAGFDAHFEDDMSGLNLLDTDYAWVTERIMEVAVVHCASRVVSALEGGYVMNALGRSAAAHIKVLMGVH